MRDLLVIGMPAVAAAVAVGTIAASADATPACRAPQAERAILELDSVEVDGELVDNLDEWRAAVTYVEVRQSRSDIVDLHHLGDEQPIYVGAFERTSE